MFLYWGISFHDFSSSAFGWFFLCFLQLHRFLHLPRWSFFFIYHIPYFLPLRKFKPRSLLLFMFYAKFQSVGFIFINIFCKFISESGKIHQTRAFQKIIELYFLKGYYKFIRSLVLISFKVLPSHIYTFFPAVFPFREAVLDSFI